MRKKKGKIIVFIAHTFSGVMVCKASAGSSVEYGGNNSFKKCSAKLAASRTNSTMFCVRAVRPRSTK